MGSHDRLRQQRGRHAEQLAWAYLRSRGYVIEATNVRYRVGELDAVAQEGSALCFVEVRSMAADSVYGAPEASLRSRKQTALSRAAFRYLEQRRPAWTGPIRFDVVAVERRPAGSPAITLIRGAFDAVASVGGW